MCRYDLRETCVSAAKRPFVRAERPRLEGETPKTESLGANRLGGVPSRQGAKRPGDETYINPLLSSVQVRDYQVHVGRLQVSKICI